MARTAPQNESQDSAPDGPGIPGLYNQPLQPAATYSEKWYRWATRRRVQATIDTGLATKALGRGPAQLHLQDRQRFPAGINILAKPAKAKVRRYRTFAKRFAMTTSSQATSLVPACDSEGD